MLNPPTDAPIEITTVVQLLQHQISLGSLALCQLNGLFLLIWFGHYVDYFHRCLLLQKDCDRTLEYSIK